MGFGDDLAPGDESFRERFDRILRRKKPPGPGELAGDMERACAVLESEPSRQRPPDKEGLPGGIVHLRPELPLVVLPDIHARLDLLACALKASFPDHGIDQPLLEALEQDRAQLLFLGDYVHSEARARERWLKAYKEFTRGFRKHASMDEEMRESLGVLQVVALLKTFYPDRVHGLKGNHENITNEKGQGNHPFGKFVLEGAMVVEYMKRFYPGAPLEALYRFEKGLPLLAVGQSLLASHAEPARFFDTSRVINYRSNPDVVEGLSWTDNGQAREGSVAAMLDHYLRCGASPEAVYLGGHRPVAGMYALRAQGRFVQFHNPDLHVAALPPVNRPFDLQRDIVNLQDLSDQGEARHGKNS
ncbi:Calcineurin-like phosphoesterase [Alkalispirochaeta americana]|uniref:Calcineurin-like phosphoesterase n=1 Tax=Alkalispirochaeta americana TaxID=159291 RepID=A0A1N6NL71_9SPIO|nr:metallophosphoesterase [Alkalispirochaeta americana]SIP92762.1 Calcineurin-like phosphoesterase [Alkalispirochaeta americana]